MLRVEGVCACTRVCMCVHVFICLPCSSCCRVTTKPSHSKGLKLETQDIELPLSPPTPFSPTPLTTLWQMHNVPRQRTALGCRKQCEMSKDPELCPGPECRGAEHGGRAVDSAVPGHQAVTLPPLPSCLPGLCPLEWKECSGQQAMR